MSFVLLGKLIFVGGVTGFAVMLWGLISLLDSLLESRH
jgi:hypothetical protein